MAKYRSAVLAGLLSWSSIALAQNAEPSIYLRSDDLDVLTADGVRAQAKEVRRETKIEVDTGAVIAIGSASVSVGRIGSSAVTHAETKRQTEAYIKALSNKDGTPIVVRTGNASQAAAARVNNAMEEAISAAGAQVIIAPEPQGEETAKPRHEAYSALLQAQRTAMRPDINKAIEDGRLVIIEPSTSGDNGAMDRAKAFRLRERALENLQDASEDDMIILLK